MIDCFIASIKKEDYQDNSHEISNLVFGEKLSYLTRFDISCKLENRIWHFMHIVFICMNVKSVFWETIVLFFSENMIWNFMQIVSNLYEMPNMFSVKN